MTRFRLGLIVAAFAAGCTTTAEVENQRFTSFTGMTMAEFMATTLITPSDYFDTGGLRVFVASKGACTMHLETQGNGRTGPEGWTILRTRRMGGCNWV